MQNLSENLTELHQSGKNQAGTGLFLVVFAGICWGLISIFIRGLSGAGFESLQIVWIRAWIAVILMALYFLATDRSLFKISPKDLWMFFGTGILSLTFFSFCYFNSIVESGAAVAVVLLYTSPIFVMILSAIFFKEKITKRKLFALVMTFAGCVLVAGLIGNGTRLSLYALMLGLGSGFGYSLYSLFGGFAVKKYRSLTITFYTLLLSGIAMSFIIHPQKLVGEMIHCNMSSWLYMVGISVVCTVIPYIAYTLGLGMMEAGKAAVLVTVEPLVGSVLGILVYREAAGLLKIIGIVMIFAAVLLLGMPENSNHKEE